MKNINELFKLYRDVIPYLFFGVLTTLVNVCVYWALAHLLGAGVILSTILAWLCAVGFAYVTNRKWVFHSTAAGAPAIAKEIVSFFACRLFTGIVDWGCMFIFVELIGLNDVVIKILANVLVIVLNYIVSIRVIFRGDAK